MKEIIKGMLVVVCVAGFLFPKNVEATNGAFLPGYHAINEAMGGAGVAFPMDTSVLLTNPAGMSRLPRLANFNFTLGTVKTSIGAADNQDDPLFLPSGAVVYPFLEKWAVGVGVFSVAGFGAEYPTSLVAALVPGATHHTHAFYGLMKIIAAGSYKITDQLSAGLAFHVNRATLQTDYGVGFVTQTAGAGHLDAALGFGVGLGILYQPFDFLSVGLNYTSEQFFNDFERYKDILPNGVNLPHQVAVGFSIIPPVLDKLVVASDFKWIHWSGAGGGLGTPAASGGFGWRDQYVLSTGLQYQLLKPLFIRAGYNYARVMLPANAAFINALIGAGGKHHLSGGLGFRLLENIDIDVSYLRTLKASVTDDGTVAAAAVNTTLSTSAHQGSVQLGVKF